MENIVLGYMEALECEGVQVTARALAEAMEIDTKLASKKLCQMVRSHTIKNLGGDPVVYSSL